MIPVFDKYRARKLKNVCESWLGTPWRHRYRLKGVGCDCIHFVLGVLEEIGIQPNKPIVVPEYPPDWHLHNTRELLRDGLKEYFNVKEFKVYQAINGDIMLSHFGRAASHAGFYVDGFFYHCTRPGGVSRGAFNDRTWREKMRFAMRFYK